MSNEAGNLDCETLQLPIDTLDIEYEFLDMARKICKKYEAFHLKRKVHARRSRQCCGLRGGPRENGSLPYQLKQSMGYISETIKEFKRITGEREAIKRKREEEIHECVVKLSDEDIKQLRMKHKLKKTEYGVKELNIEDNGSQLTVD